MTVEWTKDAVSDALDAFADARMDVSDIKAMRAALDAAVNAQGFPLPPGFYGELELIQAIAKARAEALEEAAKLYCISPAQADAICALKDKTP